MGMGFSLIIVFPRSAWEHRSSRSAARAAASTAKSSYSGDNIKTPKTAPKTVAAMTPPTETPIPAAPQAEARDPPRPSCS